MNVMLFGNKMEK